MSTAPQPQAATDAAFRMVRILHFAMISASVLYVLVGEMIAPDGFIGEARGGIVRSEEPAAMLANVFLFFGISLAFAAVILRQKLTASAQEALLRSPGNTAILGRWRMAHIVAFALAEAVVLFGLVLRILGATLQQAAVLYAVGIVALLLVAPRRP